RTRRRRRGGRPLLARVAEPGGGGVAFLSRAASAFAVGEHRPRLGDRRRIVERGAHPVSRSDAVYPGEYHGTSAGFSLSSGFSSSAMPAIVAPTVTGEVRHRRHCCALNQ